MVLIVNGEKVEESAIEREIERLRPHYEQTFADQPAEEREKQLAEWCRENVIERVLVNQDAKNQVSEVPREKVEEVLKQIKEQYKDEKEFEKDYDEEARKKLLDDIEQQIRVEQRLEAICKELPEPSKEEIEAFYNENAENFRTPEQLRVAHMVKYVNWQTDEAAAQQALQQAKAELDGGKPFEAVVDRYTDCGDAGGDLGMVTRGQMVEEFEDVIFNLSEGQVSDIFRTRFGYHIAKVYSRKPSEIAGLDEVKSHIVEALSQQKREKAIEQFVDELRSKATVEEA